MALNKQSLSGSCNDFLIATLLCVSKKPAANADTKIKGTKNKSSADMTINTAITIAT